MFGLLAVTHILGCLLSAASVFILFIIWCGGGAKAFRGIDTDPNHIVHGPLRMLSVGACFAIVPLAILLFFNVRPA